MRLRHARKWSQERLAREAGLNGRAVVASIETRPGGCLLVTALAIAGAFGTTIEAMIEAGRTAPPGQPGQVAG
jgi:DNA-binding XRE family transcriptional regulator